MNEKVSRKGGAVWRVRWRDAGGQAHSKVLGRKRDAEMFDAETKRRKRIGDLATFDGGRETLDEFARRWLKIYAVPNLAARTKRSYAGMYDRHISPRLGAFRLIDLLPEVVGRFAADLRAVGVGEPTVYRALVLLQGILQRAVEWERLAANPVRAVRKLRPSSAPARSVRCRR